MSSDLSSVATRAAVHAALDEPARLTMAELLRFNHLAGDRAIAWSGGSEPGMDINAAAVEARREVGSDISGKYPKPWTDEVVQAANVVVTPGCGDACPVFPGKRDEDWTFDDPAGNGVEQVRPIRDQIEGRVRALLDQLSVAASGHPS